MKSKRAQIPEGYDDESRLLLRFLQGVKFDREKTELAVNDHFKWKTEKFPIN